MPGQKSTFGDEAVEQPNQARSTFGDEPVQNVSRETPTAPQNRTPGFLQSLYGNTIGPIVDTGKAIAQRGGPAVLNEMLENTKQGLEDFRNNPNPGVSDYLHAVPLVGQPLGQIADQLKEGNYGGAAGGALGLGLSAMAPKAFGAARTGAADLIRPNPETALTKGLKYVPPEPAELQQAMAHVQQAHGKPIGGVKDILSAAPKAIEAHQNALDDYINKASLLGTKVNGDVIVNATRDFIPETMWLENPQKAQAIMNDVQQAYGGKQFDPSEFRQFLREKNANANSLYSKLPSAQAIADLSGTNPALAAKQATGIRNEMYSAIDPNTQGAGPRSIQRGSGNIQEMKAAAEGRLQPSIEEKPTRKIGGAGKFISGIANVPAIPFRTPEHNARVMGDIAHPFIGPTDANIRTAFGTAGEPNPLPQHAPFTPYNPPSPFPALPPASTIFGTAPDTSFVRGVNAVPSPPAHSGFALPEAKTNLVPPDPYDLSGPWTPGNTPHSYPEGNPLIKKRGTLFPEVLPPEGR